MKENGHYDLISTKCQHLLNIIVESSVHILHSCACVAAENMCVVGVLKFELSSLKERTGRKAGSRNQPELGAAGVQRRRHSHTDKTPYIFIFGPRRLNIVLKYFCVCVLYTFVIM